ncbi:Bug family tripartite tricarboxylate transporter substrate binding protein [Bordetella tumulicola]|uniref:Bug family tripartite tricarboxylate transporter substrate binding protein n=1 Tax=Bordetella tumulicola TaxID=1649133 RepID=UPI0039EE575D
MSRDKIKPIAVSSPTRQANTPDVPTFQELGYDGMTIQSWSGLVAPASTPKDGQKKLSDALTKVMQSESVKQRLASVGMNLPPDTSADALQALLTQDFARWADVVQRGGITFN